MIRYARIINEETKEVQVGVGCPDEYYVEIGMTEMEMLPLQYHIFSPNLLTV